MPRGCFDDYVDSDTMSTADIYTCGSYPGAYTQGSGNAIPTERNRVPEQGTPSRTKHETRGLTPVASCSCAGSDAHRRQRSQS